MEMAMLAWFTVLLLGAAYVLLCGLCSVWALFFHPLIAELRPQLLPSCRYENAADRVGDLLVRLDERLKRLNRTGGPVKIDPKTQYDILWSRSWRLLHLKEKLELTAGDWARRGL